LKNYEFGLRCAGIVSILVMAPTVALAYIDPGNGAYMVQALFALVGAALFYLRHPIRSLKQLWRWLSSRGRQTPVARPMDASPGVDPGTTKRDHGSTVMSETVQEDRMVR
jgi:hypothetical protein